MGTHNHYVSHYHCVSIHNQYTTEKQLSGPMFIRGSPYKKTPMTTVCVQTHNHCVGIHNLSLQLLGEIFLKCLLWVGELCIRTELANSRAEPVYIDRPENKNQEMK